MDEENFYEMVKEQVVKLPTFKKSSAYIYDQVMGFYYAVSWSREKWLQALIVTHIALLSLVIFARRFKLLQFVLFIGMTVAVFCSEYLNKMGGERWKEFSTQNYFDKHGVFTGTIYAGPLLLILTIQLILTLVDASRLVVTVKRLELGIDKKKATKEE